MEDDTQLGQTFPHPYPQPQAIALETFLRDNSLGIDSGGQFHHLIGK